MFLLMAQVLRIVLTVMVYLILGRTVISWFIRPDDKIFPYYMILVRITEPVLEPFRGISQRLTRNTGMDVAPMLAILAIYLVYRLMMKVLVLSVM